MSETTRLRLWALTKIPLLFFLRPSVVEASALRTVIRIPLSRRSRNHLGSMYFGALCAGADLAGALTAMRRIDASGRRISLIFKDVKAQFFKRAEGDVFFTCEDGQDKRSRASSSARSRAASASSCPSVSSRRCRTNSAPSPWQSSS